jgi:hypothetical protein
VISKGFEAQESKIASLSSRVATLKEEVERLSRGKKRKAIPNPNRKFMTLAEALVVGNAVSEPNQTTVETVAVEDEIEVGGVEEDESTNSEAEELPVARTRAGRAVKSQENIKIHSIPNWKIAISLLFLFLVTVREEVEK